MSYQSFWVDDTLVVRWDSRPELAAMLELLRSASERSAQRGDVALVIVIPEHVDPPDERTRAGLLSQARRLIEKLHVVVVFEGSGFRHSLKVSIITGAKMLLRLPSGRLWIRRSLREALWDDRPAPLAHNAEKIAKQFEERGITVPGPSRRPGF